MRPSPGDLVNGKYRLVRLIGEGGMGSVYEARHEFLGTPVALKFVHPELLRRPGLRERFLQEAQLAANIRSIHIAHVTDVDQTPDGAAYLVMELLQGQSLQSVLDRDHKLSRDLALDYTLQILAGLDAAHRMAAVHRDLKPDNVFIVPTPQGPLVKLLDFGIAKLRTSREFQAGLTRPGVMMGTPEYMAPEQAFSADRADARADLFAVGVMLFEMLVGRRPVQGDDPREIASRVMRNEIASIRQLDPSIPEPLAQVIHRAMAPMPEQRWASAVELRDALTPFAGALSLAGRIAATPSLSEAAAAPAEPVSTPLKTPTDTAPDAEARPYAPTGAAPLETTAPMQPLYARGATEAQAVPSYVQAGSYRASVAGYGGAPPPARRAPGGMSMGIVLALFGTAAVIAGVVAMLAIRQPDKPASPPPPLYAAPTSQPAVPGPAVPTTPIGAPIASPVAPPLAAHAQHAVPSAHDAGALRDAGPPMFPTLPQLPFPLPSQLPPFPSVLPPIPSNLPPFPFPFPGMAPAPQSSR